MPKSTKIFRGTFGKLCKVIRELINNNKIDLSDKTALRYKQEVACLDTQNATTTKSSPNVFKFLFFCFKPPNEQWLPKQIL